MFAEDSDFQPYDLYRGTRSVYGGSLYYCELDNFGLKKKTSKWIDKLLPGTGNVAPLWYNMPEVFIIYYVTNKLQRKR